MYQHSYAEVLEDDQSAARAIEARALAHVAAQLRQAAALPPGSLISIKALHDARELWMIFMGELGADDNALPDQIRANLISIGIWILKEAEAIRLGRSNNFLGIAEICMIVREGLL